MITYQQLCEQQDLYRSTLINRRKHLQELIGEFAQAIAENLGLFGKFYTERPFESNARTSKSYIKILELKSGKCEDISPHQIPVEFDSNGNPSAMVGISITLEKDEKTYPKPNIYIQTRFGLIADALSLSFVDFDKGMQISIDLEEPNKWDYAVESYKEVVMQSCTLPN
ncbi:hypothetical protein ACWA5Z_06790 [Testudinibacter sp. P80/BLE/0925]